MDFGGRAVYPVRKGNGNGAFFGGTNFGAAWPDAMFNPQPLTKTKRVLNRTRVLHRALNFAVPRRWLACDVASSSNHKPLFRPCHGHIQQAVALIHL